MAAVLPAIVLIPLAGAIATAWAPPSIRRWCAVIVAGLTTAGVAWTTIAVAGAGLTRTHLAGWRAPLGIELYVDALSAAMLAMTAVVSLVVLGYATGSSRVGGSEQFWTLTLLLWAGLNAVYISADLFNVYVALELMGLAAVGLVCLGGRSAWRPGLTYLFVAVLGSLAYLLGVAIVYAEAGTLDMAGAGSGLTAGTTAWVALVLMAAGMALKTALFPVHTWLPAAHAAAPSAVSPLLSALVIKASMYLLIRVWFTVFGGDAPPGLALSLGVLGAAAIVWGTVVALRQERIKTIVAYSTVAQVGYFFLLFTFLPVAALTDPGGEAARAGGAAWLGVLTLMISHGLAKAAMFTAAGALVLAHGHDRLDGISGAVNRQPGVMVAFALAGVSLAGIPPTLGFAGKWQLVQASLISGQWWWLPVILIGGLLTFAYTAKVVRASYAEPGDAGGGEYRKVPVRMSAVALSLAIAAGVSGFVASPLMDFLAQASPVGGAG